MPIYEYRCGDCGRAFSLFFRSFNVTETPACPRCSSTKLRKLVSRFAAPKSEEQRLDAMADASAYADVDEDDPRSVARWARKMGESMGDDLGEDFREAIDQMESGELPPEAGEGAPDSGGLDDL